MDPLVDLYSQWLNGGDINTLIEQGAASGMPPPPLPPPTPQAQPASFNPPPMVPGRPSPMPATDLGPMPSESAAPDVGASLEQRLEQPAIGGGPAYGTPGSPRPGYQVPPGGLPGNAANTPEPTWPGSSTLADRLQGGTSISPEQFAPGGTLPPPNMAQLNTSPAPGTVSVSGATGGMVPGILGASPLTLAGGTSGYVPPAGYDRPPPEAPAGQPPLAASATPPAAAPSAATAQAQGTDRIAATLRGLAGAQAPIVPTPQRITSPHHNPSRGQMPSGNLLHLLQALGMSGSRPPMQAYNLPSTLAQAMQGRG